MEIKITGEIKLTADAALLSVLDRLTTVTGITIPAGALNGLEGVTGPMTVDPVPETTATDVAAVVGEALYTEAANAAAKKQQTADAPAPEFAPMPSVDNTSELAPEPVQEPQAAPEPAPEPTPAAEPAVNLTKIRTAVLPLVQNGKQPELKAVLDKYGAKSITALPKTAWDAFAADIRALGAEI